MMVLIDWGAIVSQFPSIAVALLFAWFMDRRDTKQGQREEDRDNMWREFLEAQRQRHAESTARLAEEIKSMTAVVSANTQQLLQISTILVQHDQRAQNAIEEFRSDAARPKKK